MLAPGRATFEGRYASVRGAINNPKGLQQPHIPIIVGGNGERVTAGLRHPVRRRAELRVLEPAEIVERMAAVRARCEAEGRDPATLRFSLYTRDEDDARRRPGAGRPARRASPRPGSTGSSCFPTRWSPTPDAQAAFAEDCRAAGVSLAAPAAGRRLLFGAAARRPIRRHGA